MFQTKPTHNPDLQPPSGMTVQSPFMGICHARDFMPNPNGDFLICFSKEEPLQAILMTHRQSPAQQLISQIQVWTQLGRIISTRVVNDEKHRENDSLESLRPWQQLNEALHPGLSHVALTMLQDCIEMGWERHQKEQHTRNWQRLLYRVQECLEEPYPEIGLSLLCWGLQCGPAR